MARALAFIQFLIVGMGMMGLHILVKIGGHKTDAGIVDATAEFLAWHAIWFFTVPILYAIAAQIFCNSLDSRPLQITGFVLCVILLVLFGVPLVHYMR